jgi:hypothetical protein
MLQTRQICLKLWFIAATKLIPTKEYAYNQVPLRGRVHWEKNEWSCSTTSLVHQSDGETKIE